MNKKDEKISPDDPQVKELINKERFRILSLISELVEIRDHYDGRHCYRVMEYSLAVADKLGLSDEQKEHMKFGAILHDIGKIGIKDSVMEKLSPLSSDEFKYIQKHSELGTKILKELDFLEYISDVVLCHHERFDGKGYPLGISGNSIPLESRIIAVANAFDAMTNDRPYRKALPVDKAVEELQKHAGTQFDPKIVDIFVEGVKENLFDNIIKDHDTNKESL